MFLKLSLVLCIITAGFAKTQIEIRKDDTTLYINVTSTGLKLELNHDGVSKLSAQIGVGLNTSDVKECFGLKNCLVFERNVRLHVTVKHDKFQLQWITNDTSKVLKDCYDLSANVNWFGGPEHFYQAWPVEKLKLSDFSYVLKEDNWTAVAEPYWLNSLGAYIFVDHKVPLFIDQNSERNGALCFISKVKYPYPARNKVLLKYTLVAKSHPKEAHLHAVNNFLGKPTGHPNVKMIQRPVWSTWARYKRDVNDTTVLEFAEEIVKNGYSDGQYELDDDWEECYGALTFTNTKFSKINDTVAKLKAMGFRVTLWAHPFVNTNCKTYSQIGVENNFFVKNINGSALTQWWNSKGQDAQYLDFTNPEVREWFVERLKYLQEAHGIDSFKFDAGETSWSPQISVLNGDIDLQPNIIAEDYVRTCATFGDLVEVRAGWRTQDLPIFVRMIDKDSTWGVDNGLYTLITTLLQMNLNGYTMVLPDMVGGNGYFGRPSADLFVRWLQANAFMPSIQFSYVPWDYNDVLSINVSHISKTFVALHDAFSDEIIRVMNRSIEFGIPVNPPVWWIDPTNREAHKIDTQYLLGENVLVAPIIEANQTSRDVFIPSGIWIDGNNLTLVHGNQTLKNYFAPIDVLPFFVRNGTKAAEIAKFFAINKNTHT